MQQLRHHHFEVVELRYNTPHLFAAAREVSGYLRMIQADVLCCHGYKPDILGFLAARRVGIPVVGVSRGWTGATAKVRLYERLDRFFLQWMDHVVCVSEGQAMKVRAAGVPEERVAVIRNAIDLTRFDQLDPAYRQRMQSYFPTPRATVVCAAGRLSPEKGFDQLVEAAAAVVKENPEVGFVLFGEGPLRGALENQITARNLSGRFILAGFREDVDRFIPHADVFALPSFTEGLPNVVLEAFAASVPVVATAVGGTPEVVEDGVSGYLVPAGDPDALARRILDVLRDEERRKAMGVNARRRVEEHFTFHAQSVRYEHLFDRLIDRNHRGGAASVASGATHGMAG